MIQLCDAIVRRIVPRVLPVGLPSTDLVLSPQHGYYATNASSHRVTFYLLISALTLVSCWLSTYPDVDLERPVPFTLFAGRVKESLQISWYLFGNIQIRRWSTLSLSAQLP